MATEGRRGNWQKARDMNINGQSGEFGELLMAKILNCKLSKNRELEDDEKRNDFADIYNEEFSFRVEVKTMGNKHPFYVRLKQLRTYRDGTHLPFKITDTMYAFVSYKHQKAQKTKRGVKKNKNGGQKNFSPLTRLPMKYDRIRFFAERTDEIYILDRKIVERMRKIMPVEKCQMPGKDKGLCIKANRTDIRERLRDSAIADMANALSIRARNWVREIRTIDSVVRVDGHDHIVSCRLITILPKETHERIAQVIRFRAPSGDA